MRGAAAARCERSYLARHLEVKELLEVPLVDLVGVGDRELVLLVVGLGKVLGNGAGLPDGQVGVGVDNGGKTAIGVDLEERGVLGVGNVNLRGNNC